MGNDTGLQNIVPVSIKLHVHAFRDITKTSAVLVELGINFL